MPHKIVMLPWTAQRVVVFACETVEVTLTATQTPRASAKRRGRGQRRRQEALYSAAYQQPFEELWGLKTKHVELSSSSTEFAATDSRLDTPTNQKIETMAISLVQEGRQHCLQRGAHNLHVKSSDSLSMANNTVTQLTFN